MKNFLPEKLQEITRKWWGKLIIHSFLIALFVGFMLWATSLFLKIYTHHGQNILTPAFKGLSLKQAQETAKKYDLKLQIIDSIYSGFAKPGSVVDQTPPPNFKIKKGRRIFITIKAFKPRMVKMPDVKEISLIQAKAVLERQGLTIGKLIYGNGFKNLVLKPLYNGKEIKPGTEIPAGSKIDLIIGKGDVEEEENKTVVPDLTGMSFINAKSLAIENSLNIGAVHYDNTVKSQLDSLMAIVVKQVPAPGTKTTFGKTIELWLTKK